MFLGWSTLWIRVPSVFNIVHWGVTERSMVTGEGWPKIVQDRSTSGIVFSGCVHLCTSCVQLIKVLCSFVWTECATRIVLNVTQTERWLHVPSRTGSGIQRKSARYKSSPTAFSVSLGVKHGLRVIRRNGDHTKCFCTFYIQTFSRFRNWMMPLWHPWVFWDKRKLVRPLMKNLFPLISP